MVATTKSDYNCNPDPSDTFPHEFDFELDQDPLNEPRDAKLIVPLLSFIKNKNNWGSHLQNPRELNKEDYDIIVNYMRNKNPI